MDNKRVRLRLLQLGIQDRIEDNLYSIQNVLNKSWEPRNIEVDEEIQGDRSKKSSPFDIFLLPELFTTGYHRKDKLIALAESLNDRTVTTLKKTCREKSVSLGAGSIVEIEDNNLYNTSIAINSKGQLIHVYRKTHLFKPMKEDKIFGEGDRIGIFKISDITLGTLTCYEIRFPEIARILALQGAKIIFCPCEWPHPKGEILQVLARARAIENQLFFAVINRVGSQGNYRFCGGSSVYAPDGTQLALGSESEEEVIDVEINLRWIERYRQEIPSLKDRRTVLY